MYEHRSQKLLPRRKFAGRVLLHLGGAIFLIVFALGLGILGYHYLAGLQWIDALVNAAMILGGMGPVDPLTSSGAKVFASVYALFSGLLFIGILGIVLLPWAHRLMHKLHLEESATQD